MKSAAAIPPLTSERQALVVEWRGLVISVAQKCLHRRQIPEDAVAAGELGLVVAAAKYDAGHESAAQFPTFATWWVRAYVFKWLVDNCGPARFASGTPDRKVFFNLARAERQVGDSAAAVAAHLGVDEETVSAVRDYVRRRDVAVEDAGLVDGMNHAKAVLDELRVEEVRAAVARLPERERRILERRYFSGGDVSLAEVGREVGLSRERARQIEQKALGRLRRALRRVA